MAGERVYATRAGSRVEVGVPQMPTWSKRAMSRVHIIHHLGTESLKSHQVARFIHAHYIPTC
jgi:hypothetical protein